MDNTITSPDTGKPFAVVTGASSGIGQELAKEFARNGFDLLLAAEPADLPAAASEILALGAEVQTVAVDLAQHEGVHQLYDAIKASGRPVDAIAINAGVGAYGAG